MYGGTLAAMSRLSIGRFLRVALVGLTLVLAAIAALGVSSLYSARQKYENTLVQSSSLSTAAANLAANGIGPRWRPTTRTPPSSRPDSPGQTPRAQA
jgi:hypothetical protein